jgi:DNA-binding response OmpR family regulator
MENSRKPRVLIVEDEEMVRETIKAILEDDGFEVMDADSVNAALEILNAQKFDVLVSDLHMPLIGDGLTVVSAMRHLNPEALTLIMSGFPEMDKAAAALLAQADGILVKPSAIRGLGASIWERLKKVRVPAPAIATVATILEEESQTTIADWLGRVDQERSILTVNMNDKERSAHLPQMFKDLVARLRAPLELGTRAFASPAAVSHGVLRRKQGYTAAMMVEESRMLQVSIFQTLQNNLFRVRFDTVLESVMAIADEVDSQLAQAMTSYVSESNADALPTVA